ncbi:MAG: hypothetical protein Q7R47_04025 [Candidatus Diapherotrites archaeon]|nr:hypothetical protein [Candidatus Diapherotrites archaeon]
MKKNIAMVLAALAILVLLAGCAQTQSNTPPLGNNPPPSTPSPKSATINITANGYEPATVTIAKGGTVTWVNDTDTLNWPASAKHPTHTTYPGSGIEKCATAEQPGIFDACHALAKGEEFSFTFNSVGQWAFHDHIAAKTFGKVIVTE